MIGGKKSDSHFSFLHSIEVKDNAERGERGVVRRKDESGETSQ